MPISLYRGWLFTQDYVSGAAAGSALAHAVPAPGANIMPGAGAFGPEASLAALLVCVAVSGAALWLA